MRSLYSSFSCDAASYDEGSSEGHGSLDGGTASIRPNKPRFHADEPTALLRCVHLFFFFFFSVLWFFISSRCQSSFWKCVHFFQDLHQEKAFHWKPCRSHLLSPPPTACPLPAPMVTSLLPTITCLITWRARWGGWTWRVLFSRYVQPALLTYLRFILASQDPYFSTRVLLIASICLPSGSATSTKPHAAGPTSSPTHACRHPIFPRSSQHDLCPRWCPHRASHHHSATN